ncbi:MAG TPA: TonB-dependent receptor, partial [Cellvibrio sp.]|nr:TonB-dependent receptor [Cellvibrio sp.]
LSTIRIGDPELINNGIDPLHFLVPVQFVNDMYGHTRGAEITSGWTLTPTLQVSASYSYLYMSLITDDEDREAAERLSPRHRASARVYWDIRENIMLGATASYADRLPASDVDSYVRLDLNLGVELTDNVRFNLVGQNLLDSAHREFGTIDDINVGEIERSIFAKLTWQFR